MSTLLVSGAGVGDAPVPGSSGSTEFGDFSSASTALGIFPPGLVGGIGFPKIAPPAAGANVVLDFVTAFSQAGANVRLDFDLTRPLTGTTLGSQTIFGTTVATNVAQGWTNVGIDSLSVGRPLVSFDLAGRSVNFNFVAAYTPQPAINVGLYFDGTPVVASAGLKDQSAFGATKLEQMLQLRPSGISPPDPLRSVLIVGPGSLVNFNFVDAYTPPNASMVRLDFDALRPIPLVGFDTLAFGGTTIVNAQPGALVAGLDFLRFGIGTRISGDEPGRAVNFNFIADYFPITGINVAFAFGDEIEAIPPGFDSSEFGGHFIGTPPLIFVDGFDSLVFGAVKVKHDAIRPPGWDSLEVGPVSLGTIVQYTRPDPIASLEFGATFVSHRHQQAQVPGIGSAEYGATIVSNAVRVLRPDGRMYADFGMHVVTTDGQVIYCTGILGAAGGVPTVTSSIGTSRKLHPEGWEDTLFGMLMIAYERRFIEVDSLLPGRFGAHNVAQQQFVYPEGWSSRSMGRTTDVIRFYPSQTLLQWGSPSSEVGVHVIKLAESRQMEGIDSAEYGNAEVHSSWQFVNQGKYLNEEYGVGEPLVYNLTQVISLDTSEISNFANVGLFTKIENYDKGILAFGWVSSRFPTTHGTLLPDQVVRPPSLGWVTEIGKGTTVTHWLRHVYPEPIWPSFFTPFHTVHNSAIDLSLRGFDSSIVPRPTIEARQQRVYAQTLYRPDTFGTPLFTFHTRTVTQIFSDNTGRVSEPVIGFAVRYIYPVWEEFLERIISINHIVYRLPDLYVDYVNVGPITGYGRATVKNVTPQLYAYTINSLESGYHWVSHSPRYIPPASISQDGFGATTEIANADRTVYARSAGESTVGWPKVWQELFDIPTDQFITDASVHLIGEWLGRPYVASGVFPAGWVSGKFGTTIVSMQGCRPRWDWAESDFQFGFPSLNATQHITQINKPGELGSQSKWSPQCVSPHTIWCRFDTPTQAYRNHPDSQPWYNFDEPPTGYSPPFPRFGDARISAQGDQTLFPHHEDYYDQTVGNLIGEPTVENEHRTIFLQGIKETLFGYPKLNGPHRIRAKGFLSPELGEHFIGREPFGKQYIILESGISPPEFEDHAADNYHRPIYPRGFDATIYGDNHPMVYHHPRGPKNASGTDMQVFGPDTWISYEHRELPTQGFDSFEEGYTDGAFDQRLRVSKGAAKRVCTVGDSLKMGYPSVQETGTPQYIRPYMIPPPQYCHPHSIGEG